MCRHIRHIAHPGLIRSGDGELPIQHVRRHGLPVAGVGGAPVAAFVLGNNLMPLHEARHAMPATRLALLAHGGMDPRLP